MLQLKNESPFASKIALFPDIHGIETLVVAIKGTFTLAPKLELAEEQQPIIAGDEYWGDPTVTSLKYAGEFHLPKPATDIALIGCAQPPNQRTVQEIDTHLSVGQFAKKVRVTGDRHWEKGILSLNISQPLPFESMPLRYERAYGGRHVRGEDHHACAANPVGRGYSRGQSAAELLGMPLPNLEELGHLITKPQSEPQPACYGFLAPSWQPRVKFAGTYDEAWQQQRAPYLPDDFDPRYFNAASTGMVCEGYLVGGEAVTLENLFAGGTLQFQLPEVTMKVEVLTRGVTTALPLSLETVLFEPEESRMTLLWRAVYPCDKKALRIERTTIALQRMQLQTGGTQVAAARGLT